MPIEAVVYVVWGLAALGLLNFVYRAFRNRGLAGAAFGAPIESTIGELDLGRQGRVGRTLRVHRLRAAEPGSPELGVEVVARTFGGIAMSVIPLTRPQAVAMRDLLAEAISQLGNTAG